MKRVLSGLFLLIFTPLLQAQTTAMELRSGNGDVFSIQKLANGEVWGSFFLSDTMVDSFAQHELIVMQVDSHKPVKLEHSLRSCGAPAPQPQQFVYQFDQNERLTEWQFEGRSRTKQNVLKVLGWDAADYQQLAADRRAEVVDFPLKRDESLATQLLNAEQISFRYVTDRGQQRETWFQLAPHRHILEQILP